MSAPDFAALIERIREKSVCPELDVEIFRAIGNPLPNEFGGLGIEFDWDDAGRNAFAVIGELRVKFTAPPYTRTLDAASSAFPAEAMYRSGHSATDPSTFFCDAVAPDGIASFHTLEETEVAARLIAALQMRAAA